MAATDQVSVRLSVQGGDQFRAAMQAAGASGEQAFDRIGRASRGLTGQGRQLTNLAMQVNQVGQSYLATGQFAQSLAVQLPDLLQGFGGLPAILAGSAVAIGASFIVPMITAKEKTVELSDQMAELSKNIQSYRNYAEDAGASTDDLAAKFGAFAGQVRGFSAFMAGVAQDVTFETLRTTISPLTVDLYEVETLIQRVAEAQSNLNRYVSEGADFNTVETQRAVLAAFEGQLASATSALGVTQAQAETLLGAFQDLGEADTMAEIAERSGVVQALLQSIAVETGTLPPALREAASAVDEMGRLAAEAVTQVEGLAEAAPASTWMDDAMGGTNALISRLILARREADALRAAASDNYDLALAQTGQSSGPDAVRTMLSPRSIGLRAAAVPTGAGLPFVAATSGSSGGGGGADSVAAEAKRVFDATRTSAEQYAAEIENLNRLLKAGAIDQDTYNRAAAKARDEFQTTGDLMSKVAGTVRGSLSSFFDGIVEGGGKAGQAIDSLKNRLLSMTLEASFTGALSMLAPNIFGAGGFLPLVASANGNAFSGGRLIPFANGGVVGGPMMFPMRGATGLMGEAGPEAIMPLTRIGGKLGVRAAGGGGSNVQVQINNYTGQQVREERTTGPDGREVLKVTVGQIVGEGGIDRQLASRTGGSVTKKARG